MLDCPVCKTGMKQEKVHDVTVDVCDAHGIWLDKKELFLITERERHDVGSFSWNDLFRRLQKPGLDLDRKLSCVMCEQEMKIDRYEDVHIDVCLDHGVWLDVGELEAVLNNLRMDPAYVRGVALRVKDMRF